MRNPFLLPTVLLIFGISLMGAEVSYAQRGGSSLQQNQGQNASPFGQGGSGAFNPSGVFNSSGVFDQSGLGQQGLGQQGIGGQGPAGQTGNQNRQGATRGRPQVGGQDGFVGTDAEQIRDRFRDPRQQQRSLFDFAIDSLNDMRESQRQRDQQRNRTPPVRVKIRPLFAVAPMPPAEITAQAQTNLQAVLPASASNTQVSVSGGTATIRGAVGSDYDRKLAAKMLSMQPGIYQVDNQLTVTRATPIEVSQPPSR